MKGRNISRNPFARENVIRVSVATAEGCRFCGGKRKGGKRLFQYVTETDGGRTFGHKGLFCSKNCHDAYHC